MEFSPFLQAIATAKIAYLVSLQTGGLTLKIRLLNSGGLTPNPDNVWSAISSFECGFAGYAPQAIDPTAIPVASETTLVWSFDTPPALFTYNGADSGLTSETAYAAVLVAELSGAVQLLLAFQNLISPKAFAGNGDFLVLQIQLQTSTA